MNYNLILFRILLFVLKETDIISLAIFNKSIVLFSFNYTYYLISIEKSSNDLFSKYTLLTSFINNIFF